MSILAAVAAALAASVSASPEARAAAFAPLPAGAHAVRRERSLNAATTIVLGLPQLTYQGGPVLSHVEVVPVLWGPGVSADVRDGIGAFYAGIVDSTAFDWLSEYATDQAHGSKTIGRGTARPTVTITPAVSANGLTNVGLAAELVAQIAAGHLPAPGAETIYMVHLPVGLDIALGADHSCIDPVKGVFCAFHGSTKYQGHDFFYGVMPDQSEGGCAQACGLSPLPFDNASSTSFHELIEAVTDPLVGANILSWYDGQPTDPISSHGEIGDICANFADDQTTVALKTGPYKVQREWSNLASACTSAADDLFTFTVGPSTPQVRAGASQDLTITTTIPIADPGQDVQIILGPLPGGVRAALSTFLVKPGQAATLKLSVEASVPAQSFPLALLLYGTRATIYKYVNVEVQATEFALAVAPASASLTAGAATTLTVTTTAAAGSPVDTLTLTATSLPVGVVASFSPAAVQSGHSSQLTLTALPGAQSATHTAHVVGTGANAVHSADLLLSLLGDDFGVAAAGSAASIAAGGFASVPIATSVVHGAPQVLAMTVSGLPDGVTAAFSPVRVVAGQPVVLTLAVGASVAPASSVAFKINAAGIYGATSTDGLLVITAKSSGCASGGGALAFALAPFLLFALGRTRRRRSASALRLVARGTLFGVMALVALGVAGSASAAVDAPLPHLAYVGGPVLPSVKVVAVFWGPGVDASVQQDIGKFISSAVQSPLMDSLAEYSTDVASIDGAPGTHQTIGRGSFVGAITIAPLSIKTVVAPHDIEVELAAQIDANKLPAPDANTYYLVYLPPAVALAGAGCPLCGTHRAVPHGSAVIYYGLVPDCARTCAGSSAQPFDNFTALTWFEVFRGVTDPHRVLGYVAPPRGWVDTTFGDIGLICDSGAAFPQVSDRNGSFTAADGSRYSVHKAWSNRANACLVDPAAAFTLVLDPAAPTVPLGGSGTIKLKLGAAGSGPALPVTFDTTTLPDGVTAEFSPAQVTTGQEAALLLKVGPDAPTGFQFQVRAYTANTVVFAEATISAVNLSVAVQLSPPVVALVAGGTAKVKLSTALAGPSAAAQTLTPSAPMLPPGVTAAFDPATVQAGQDFSVTFSAAADVAALTAPIAVAVTGPAGTRTAAGLLSVTGSDFSVGLDHPGVALAPGGSAVVKIATAQSGSGAPALALTVPDLPDGLTASFDAASIAAGGGATLTLRAAATAAQKASTATITATAPHGVRTAQLAISVVAGKSGCASSLPGAEGMALALLFALRRRRAAVRGLHFLR